MLPQLLICCCLNKEKAGTLYDFEKDFSTEKLNSRCRDMHMMFLN